MSQNALELDLDEWDARSDGLILFDSFGNFRGCSPKMAKLAGSEQALRSALEISSWPRDFALSGTNVSITEDILPLPAASRAIEFHCARTSGGFVAAARFAPRPEAPARDFVLEIFHALMRERRALSRHLHGALTQDLVALSLSLNGMAPGGANVLSAAGADVLSSAIAHVDRCCRGVRALSYILAPPSFLDAGLVETIAWYGDVLRADTGIEFIVEADQLPKDPPQSIKELFFAGVQQMAAAAIWRPENSCVHACIRYRQGMLSLRVICRCRPDEPVFESPLIRERARALGGRSRLTGSEEETALEISIPWTADGATAAQETPAA